MTKIISVTFAILSMAHSAQAWWGNGHMIVARIAHDLIKPDVLEKADTILSHLSKFTALED